MGLRPWRTRLLVCFYHTYSMAPEVLVCKPSFRVLTCRLVRGLGAGNKTPSMTVYTKLAF